MSSVSLDQALQAISTSLDSTLKSIDVLNSKTDTPDLPPLVQDLLQKTAQDLPEGVSLLDLKNNAMLSYLNNIIIVLLARVEAMKTNDINAIEEDKEEAVKRSIVQRVVMERGIKNLEKKLQYQLEKMIRNYTKMENDSSESTVTKKLEAANEDTDLSEGDTEEDSEDELNYRPDPTALMKATKSKSNSSKKSKDEGEKKEDKTEKYKPPKISATLPPQMRSESARPQRNGKKLQAMEEYLAETGDTPLAEQSIGSNILNHGRGGVQSARERLKEQEIKQFEESNFTRLSTNLSKKDKAAKKRQQADTFFGEDWGIFNSKGGDDNMNTKRRKTQSAWDRAKRRQ